jgi:hypothetical protein
MYGRLYPVVFTGVAVTAQQDLFEVVAAATGMVLVHELELSQSTEVGDAQEEGLSILTKSGSTTTGSGGSTPTAIPRNFGDTAFAGTPKVNNTTKATTGTIVTHDSWNWNVRIPFLKVWTPETRPIISPSRRWTVELATTPADSITMSGTLRFSEIS